MTSTPLPSPNTETILPRWAQPRAVIFGILFYCLLFGGLRLVVSQNLGIDEVGEALLAQDLSWGYSPRQPPLYAWIAWATHQTIGLGTWQFVAIKYLGVFAIFTLFFAVARALIDPRRAALATICLTLLYQIGWNLHSGFTHSIVLMVFILASLLVWVKLSSRPTSSARYALLGVLFGLGLLSKYGFAAFLIALLLASLMEQRFRALVINPRLLIALAVATLIISPYALWLQQNAQSLVAVSATTMSASGEITARASGVAALAAAILGYLAPLWLLLLVLYRRSFRLKRDLPFWLCVIGLGLALVGILVFGLSHFKERWMHALLLTAPLALVGALPNDTRQRWLIVSALTLMGIGVLVRIAEPLVGPPLCHSCRGQVPYEGIYDALHAQNIAADTIYSDDGYVVGQLVVTFPKARVLFSDDPRPGFTPPTPGRCLFVTRQAQPGATEVIAETMVLLRQKPVRVQSWWVGEDSEKTLCSRL